MKQRSEPGVELECKVIEVRDVDVSLLVTVALSAFRATSTKLIHRSLKCWPFPIFKKTNCDTVIISC